MRKALKRMLIAAIVIVVVLVAWRRRRSSSSRRARRRRRPDRFGREARRLSRRPRRQRDAAGARRDRPQGWRHRLIRKAFGVADGPASRPATTPAVYHFWSVTKLFTATAVMQLVEDGKIGLDDPVTKYLPASATGCRSGAPAASPSAQLLNHTSGMKDLAPGICSAGSTTSASRRSAKPRWCKRAARARICKLASPPGAGSAPTAMPATSFSARWSRPLPARPSRTSSASAS